MNVLIDANILYSTVQRMLIFEIARGGGFAPFFSERILSEWVHAAGRAGPEARAIALGDAALLRASWPGALVTPPSALDAELWLPDPADVHVFAAAIHGGCDLVLTQNLRDFPREVLAERGIAPSHPDAFLLGLLKGTPGDVSRAALSVLGEVRRQSGQDWSAAALFKKARLPRFAKALGDGPAVQ